MVIMVDNSTGGEAGNVVVEIETIYDEAGFVGKDRTLTQNGTSSTFNALEASLLEQSDDSDSGSKTEPGTSVLGRAKELKQRWWYPKLVIRVASNGLRWVDFITDFALLMLVYQKGRSEGEGYAITTFFIGFSIFAPYIIGLSSWMQILARQLDFRDVNWMEMVLFSFLLFPTGILWFLTLDVLDMLTMIVGEIPLFLFCGIRYGDSDAIKKTENFFSKLGLTYAEVEGYMQQKAIATLFFESIPQLIVQSLMIFGVLPSVNDDSMHLMFISIGAAFINTVWQLNKMVLEARQLHEDVLDYFLICMNGRFNWVPFLNHFELNANTDEIKDINYKDIQINLILAKIQMKFRFSNLSIMQVVDKLTFLNGALKRKIILGKSCELVSIQRMVKLMIAAHGKAEVDYSDVNWRGVISNSQRLGHPVDKMADGSSITHYVFDYAPDLAEKIIPMIIDQAQNDPSRPDGRTILDRCVELERWELASKISRFIYKKMKRIKHFVAKT